MSQFDLDEYLAKKEDFSTQKGSIMGMKMWQFLLLGLVLSGISFTSLLGVIYFTIWLVKYM